MSIRAFPLATLLLFMAVSPLPAAADPFDNAVRALQKAVDGAEADSILVAQSRFRAIAAARPADARPHYWIAVSEWRAVPLLHSKDKALAKKHCESGIAEAEAAAKLDPASGEALAIKASLQGLSLAYQDPSVMMTLGPEMSETMRKAITLSPENPRVRLLDGIQTMHRPAFVGGGADKAMPVFEKAIALFEKEKPDSAAAWGREDALIWAGQAAMRLEQFEAARDYYRRALAIRPGQRWVAGVLLPAAEKALAGSQP